MLPNPQRLMLVLGTVLVIAEALPAQELPWRHDILAAREEAKKSARPILYDFGTKSCFWCKRLDATTFRVPAVSKLMVERFVLVKVDAEQETVLTREFAVQSFPTLIVVGPTGKVLGRHVDYAEPAQMTRFLEEALARMPASPKLPLTATSPSPPLPPLELPKQEKTPLARPGDKRARARELLRLARQDYDGRCYMACLERCRVVTSSYGDLEEADQARQLARLITTDPENWQCACARLRDSLGELYFKKAQELLKSGQRIPAKEYLERVVEVCPGSAWARSARAILNGAPASGTQAITAPKDG